MNRLAACHLCILMTMNLWWLGLFTDASYKRSKSKRCMLWVICVHVMWCCKFVFFAGYWNSLWHFQNQKYNINWICSMCIKSNTTNRMHLKGNILINKSSNLGIRSTNVKNVYASRKIGTLRQTQSLPLYYLKKNSEYRNDIIFCFLAIGNQLNKRKLKARLELHCLVFNHANVEKQANKLSQTQPHP